MRETDQSEGQVILSPDNKIPINNRCPLNSQCKTLLLELTS